MLSVDQEQMLLVVAAQWQASKSSREPGLPGQWNQLTLTFENTDRTDQQEVVSGCPSQ
jgi:hypothetical protein